MAFAIFFLLHTATVLLAQESIPTVRLSYGLLNGSWKSSFKGRPFASFEGVPYASPPVGKYRFRVPQQLKPWVGTWNATKPPFACIQYEPLFSKTIGGSEDCLFVNVYTPTLTPDAPLPVVVFIHGGRFLYGQGVAYDPSYLMDRDLVLVTMNFRLGPFGFLTTGDEVIPGNNGLKDQSAALHWVRNNIQMFGGNPDSITLAGTSSGAASVYYHYLSPLSRGTFHRGIAFSGSTFAPMAYSMKPAQKAKAIAAIVGCSTDSSKDILECLNSKPALAILKAQLKMFKWKLHARSPFVPTAEAVGTEEPFLNLHPYHAASIGAIANVPLLTSVVSEEGLFPAAIFQSDPTMLIDLEDNWETLASEIFLYHDTLPLEERADVAAKIKQHYLGNQPVSQETFQHLVKALGDRLFVTGVGRMAQMHALKTNQPVYVYRYSFRGTASMSRYLAHNDKNYGVCHGDDTMLIFEHLMGRMQPTDKEDLAMIDALVNMVYTYASTGVPTVTDSGPQWTPIKPGASELHYLEIMSPNKSEMRSSVDFGQRSFWDGLGFYENERYNVYNKDEL